MSKGINIEVYPKPDYVVAEGDTRVQMYQKRPGGNWKWWVSYFDSSKRKLQEVIETGFDSFE